MIDKDIVIDILNAFKSVKAISEFSVEDKHKCIREITMIRIDEDIDDKDLEIRLKIALSSFDENNFEKYIIRSKKEV